MRSYSWYRKGLYSENVLDSYLSYWNSIAVMGDSFCEKNERTNKGSINKIWNTFEQVWGENISWPIIGGKIDWINENSSLRNLIAHGGKTVDVKFAESIIDKVDEVKSVSHKLLNDWSIKLDRPLLK